MSRLEVLRVACQRHAVELQLIARSIQLLETLGAEVAPQRYFASLSTQGGELLLSLAAQLEEPMQLAAELLPLSALPEVRMQLGVLPLGERSQLT